VSCPAAAEACRTAGGGTPVKGTSWCNRKSPCEAHPAHCFGAKLSFLRKSDDYSTYATQARMRMGLAKDVVVAA